MIRGFKLAIIIVFFAISCGTLFLRSWPDFGGTVAEERLKKAQASTRYQDGQFQNTWPHPALEFGDVWSYLKEQFFGGQTRVPPSAIPVAVITPSSLQTQPGLGLRALWLGHSSVYLELDGLRLLVDPVFSDYASPFAGVGPKRFHRPPVAMADLPRIDAVVISHDHYDHLDMRAIRKLSSDETHFFVPLGVGAHLDEWGVPKDQITELDWWASTEFEGLTIVCTPAQHYSSRGIFDYKATLWSSWSLIGPQHRVFYSGDTGFADHFRQIGDRFGPFDLGLIKIGQYGPGASWIYSHMDPEAAIEASLAVRAHRVLPVSWGTFNIAFHDWDEPIKRAVVEAEAKNVDLVTPLVGEVVTAGEPFTSLRWWETVR